MPGFTNSNSAAKAVYQDQFFTTGLLQNHRSNGALERLRMPFATYQYLSVVRSKRIVMPHWRLTKDTSLTPRFYRHAAKSALSASTEGKKF
ncbi:hypothetical protein [Synechocystis sp. PCC 7509]|uniref:hypothetical protein n=1 Tax=Synechocystis sp. PCC 7509 TaxID=927677 RepID=UPI0002AC2AA0|nr:hypothetical protein [Synechocystis sp. PCC 7509]